MKKLFLYRFVDKGEFDMENMTRNYSDAICFLDDLVVEINQPWFTLLRNTAVLSGSSTIEPILLDQICGMVLGEKSTVPTVIANILSSPEPLPISPNDFMEQISAFSNFKLLSNTLQVDFKKPITLIFGTNGSGKSSLCDSFKVLANPSKPSRPLKNARASNDSVSTFSYKFHSDCTTQTWTPSSGYGSKADRIKYFDSTIASQNVTIAVEPSRVITLTPFKLGVFEIIKTLTNQIRETIKGMQDKNFEILKQTLAELITECKEFHDSPISSMRIDNMNLLKDEIAHAEVFNQQKEIADIQTSISTYEKAMSDDGLKVLRIELHDLKGISYKLSTLADSAEKIWNINPAEKAIILERKKVEQQTLADTLIPKGASQEGFISLLKTVSIFCELDEDTGQVCPLCRRKLEETQIKLFKQYHELVNSHIESEITTLHNEIDIAGELAQKVYAIKPQEWDDFVSLSPEIIAKAKAISSQIILECGVTLEPSDNVKKIRITVREFIQAINELLEIKSQAIEASTKDRSSVSQLLDNLRLQIKPLIYYDFLSKRLDKLHSLQQIINKSNKLGTTLTIFPPLLTKITNMAKKAYEKLVVSDFEARLNQEYKNLTEKDMNAFGVSLKRIGAEASVTVKPQVGGNSIDEVLSEGELRVHSLALFFAELECTCCPVLVYDDPASSFDYNYIANYCNRLRDFTLKHETCQIIVLTHNWEFFIQLQTTFNNAGLNNKLSVQVLENCSIVSDYSEKIDELKRDITSILTEQSEPTILQKENIAGKMRRLIEAIINTHVFNGQRHQYKQRSQQVSVFKEYIKVTPLTQNEAIELGDLYSKLSITEHDDPRNAIINTEKTVLQLRFDKIVSIESAIIKRK